MLDEPRFVRGGFLDATALECRLPPVDREDPAGSDPGSPDRPLARWQVKVRPPNPPLYYCLVFQRM